MDIILYIAAIIVMIWSFAVQGRLKSLVKKYSQEEASSGKTANDCVREMLAVNDVYGVTMDHVGGELTDNFNPKENKIYLSDSVDGGTSITAIAIDAEGREKWSKERELKVTSPTPTAIRTIKNDVPKATDTPAYNLIGVPVGPDYRGIVIKNGKKYINK